MNLGAVASTTEMPSALADDFQERFGVRPGLRMTSPAQWLRVRKFLGRIAPR